jgi:osmotically-inducible protein OsmY
MPMNDNKLTQEVKQELEWEPMVDAANVGVEARDGSVTLTGYVPSYSAERAAVRAAERVHGIQSVANEIAVRLDGVDSHDDRSISEAIEQRFRWSVLVPETVKAEVRQGFVTLSGDVDWYYQRQEAETVVRDVKGVKGVANEIGVKPHVRPREIENAVSSAIKRNAELDARSIWVTTDNGTVHLHGNVHSFHERESAELVASAAPGVVTVDNQIKVSP